MNRECPLCKNQYDDGGDRWKVRCYPCWKNYSKFARRIEIKKSKGYHDIYITHPSVTKEELEQWIEDNHLESGWGAEEIDLTKYKDSFKIWQVYTNFD